MRLEKYILFVLILFPVLSHAYSGIRYVTSTSADSTDGSLRLVLQAACDDAGDDTITFADTHLDKIRIKLESPLVIPEDCRGKITLEGSSQVDTLLNGNEFTDGGDVLGDSCILNVYSDGHVIRNFSFVNNELGAGICLFGRNNLVEENRFGKDLEDNEKPNRYGIVVGNILEENYPDMDGSGNEILSNQIYYNTSHGIWAQGENIVISENEIHGNGEGGIAVFGDDSFGIEMTQNLVSQNYGSNLGIDLGVDDETYNDRFDVDEGANDLLNCIDYFQAFPLPSSDGEKLYWSWGVASSGNKVEVYLASKEDWDRGAYQGGSEEYLGDKDLENATFVIDSDEFNFSTDDTLTFLSFDEEGNTSEFGYSVPVGEDSDLDGIIDEFETGDGSSATEGSSSGNADSDGDGLADVVEDKNRNGIWDADAGETSSFIADSDEDGVSDFYEVRADNQYDAGYDTDPLGTDSDGDSLQDGAEDTNGNGVLEVYLNETDPLSSDTDQDGYDDSSDNCPSVYNPTQNSGYCQI